jgi:heptose I phosphotransferase
VYLKRHYQLPRWTGWLAAVWPRKGWSPALREWQHLEWARNRGLPVPEPVAAGEYIGPLGRLQSFLAVEELDGMAPLHEAIPAAAQTLAAPVFQRWKRGLIREMVRLTCKLHRRRCAHKDLYLCHFYVAERATGDLPTSWHGLVHLIDLHRLGQHCWLWRLWQIKDLAQLLYSSDVAGVQPRDRMRFWKLYCCALGERERGWLRRLVLFKCRRYVRHNSKRRAAEKGSDPLPNSDPRPLRRQSSCHGEGV